MLKACRSQRGLSMVELMVGVAVGLFVVAGATVAVSNQLGDNRRLMLETQIQQDLRAAADVIARDIRRSGYWARAEDGVWHPAAVGVEVNPYTALEPAASGVAASSVSFTYSRGLPASEGSGFRLGASGAIEMLTGGAGGAWQALTDSTTLRVTNFTVTLTTQDVQLKCVNLCAGGGEACWPTQSVRDVKVEIAGTAVHDPTLLRNARSNVRVRNDVINGACPA